MACIASSPSSSITGSGVGLPSSPSRRSVAFGCASAVTSSWKPAPERGPLRSVMSERSDAIATSVTTSLSSFTGATATRFGQPARLLRHVHLGARRQLGHAPDLAPVVRRRNRQREHRLDAERRRHQRLARVALLAREQPQPHRRVRQIVPQHERLDGAEGPLARALDGGAGVRDLARWPAPRASPARSR